MAQLIRPGVLMSRRRRGSFARTYTDFVAYITAQAVNGAADWAGAAGIGKYTTTAAAATGTMRGSPWLKAFAASAVVCRSVQHSLPDQSTFDAQIAAGRQIYFEWIDNGVAAVTALDRNGYLSLSNAALASLLCTRLLYWDGTQAQEMNLATGAGPTPFVIP